MVTVSWDSAWCLPVAWCSLLEMRQMSLILPLSHHKCRKGRENTPRCLDCSWSARDLLLLLSSDLSCGILVLSTADQCFISGKTAVWGEVRHVLVCSIHIILPISAWATEECFHHLGIILRLFKFWFGLVFSSFLCKKNMPWLMMNNLDNLNQESDPSFTSICKILWKCKVQCKYSLFLLFHHTPIATLNDWWRFNWWSLVVKFCQGWSDRIKKNSVCGFHISVLENNPFPQQPDAL